MISFKEATAKAVEYVKQIYPETSYGYLVEEIELDETKSFWFVTLSFPLDDSEMNPFLPPNWLNSRRFKSLKIDARTGEVLSMKIREFQQ